MRLKICQGQVIILSVLVILSCFVFGCARQAQEPSEKIDLTLQELSYYNGQEGKPAYVAIDGDVYDVTKCRYWRKGVHKQDMKAGSDLTNRLNESKHGKKYLKRYPIVGRLVESHFES